MMTDRADREIIDKLAERARELGWRIQKSDTDNYYAFYLFPPNSAMMSVYTHKKYRMNGIHLDYIGSNMGVEEDFRLLTGHDYPPGGDGDGCAVVPLSIMKGMLWTTEASNG